jgi:hypothetical protein
MRKPAIIRKIALVAALTGVFGICAARLAGGDSPAVGPCEWEEMRDNRETAGLLGGTFNHESDWRWDYKLPPGTTPAMIEKTLADNGYDKFFDPFHDGKSYMKSINGRWYHYIVHADSKVESHWEKSKPASLSHMTEFWKSWERPFGSACKPPKP